MCWRSSTPFAFPFHKRSLPTIPQGSPRSNPEPLHMPLVDHPTGNYRFLPGIAPYSCGVVSAPGHEIVHVTLHRPVPWREGFERIRAELDVEDRPLVALCAVELRSPRPFSFPGFAEFNAEYAKVL